MIIGIADTTFANIDMAKFALDVFKDNEVLLMPLGDLEGIGLGNDVIPTGHTLTVRVGKHLLGRVLDGLGDPLDEKTIKCRPFG